MTPDTTTILIIAAAVIITAVVSVIFTRRKTIRKVAYMMDALEDNETNFNFRDSHIPGRKLNRTLNRIRTIFENEMDKMRKQEIFFGDMLDNVTTGIVVLGEDGQAIYSNRVFREIFGILSLINIRQLAAVGQEVYEAFEKADEGHEAKASFIGNMTKMSVSLKASYSTFGGQRVKIISVNDISSELEENEAAAWSKLIRVLTHEIMNTVTPISSLSDSLVKFADSPGTPELKEGLETISRSSKGLIKFVNTYRSLTLIPAPVKKVLYVDDLVERALHLLETGLEASDVAYSYTPGQDGLIIYADADQVLQIIINIIKNAIQAGATEIRINSRTDAVESVFIDICNNGAPVSPESREEIFVPFYTTKQDGSGIGLSLSRQIMRQHNGNLLLTRSDPTETVFTLVFK